MHLQAPPAVGQTERVLDVKAQGATYSRHSWAASLSMVLEYATGHQMKVCQIRTLSALAYLSTSKGLSACCDSGDNSNYVCGDSAINDHYDVAAFLSDKLGVSNRIVEGKLSFKAIVSNINNDRPVIVWLQNRSGVEPLSKVVVVSGYSSFGERPPRYGRELQRESLVVLDPLKRPDQIERIVPYADVQSGYVWTATIVLDVPGIKRPRWVSSDEKTPIPLNAIRAGLEGQPMYVCRAGTRIGQLIDRTCQVTYASTQSPEVFKSNYEVLIGDQLHTSWDVPGGDYVGSVDLDANPFVAERRLFDERRLFEEERRPGEDRRAYERRIALERERRSLQRQPSSFLCRVILDGKVFLGTVNDRQCGIINAGERQNISQFETLNFRRTITSELPTTVLEVELSQELTNAENKFTEEVKKLVVVKGTLPDGGTLEGYNVNQAKQTVERGKLWLVEYLGDPSFAGITAYVNRFYPLADNLVTFQIRAEHQLGRLDLKKKHMRLEMSYLTRNHFVRQPQDVLATTGSVDAAIAAVFSFFAKLRANVKAINLSIVSEPDEAGVELKTGRGRGRTTSTNSKFTNVFRGLYTYTIKKNGYKDIHQELNLVDEEGTTLKCKLYLSNDRDGPYPCSLK